MEDAAIFTSQLKEEQSEDATGDSQGTSQPNEPKPKKGGNASRGSITDPDSRMSVKPGKVMKLNYPAVRSISLF
jgi:hypothetical protein